MGRVVQEWRGEDSMKSLLSLFGRLSINYSLILVSGLRRLSIYYPLVFNVRVKINGVGPSNSMVAIWIRKERKVEGVERRERGAGACRPLQCC